MVWTNLLAWYTKPQVPHGNLDCEAQLPQRKRRVLPGTGPKIGISVRSNH